MIPSSRRPAPPAPSLASRLAGYGRNSLILVAVFLVVALVAAVIWREHLVFTWEEFDPLLLACWLGMVLLAAWRVDARRDVPLAMAAFAGGALIETWGTRSGLWTYFTNEQPPLFILPAWPFAALATERVVALLMMLPGLRQGPSGARTNEAETRAKRPGAVTWIVLVAAWVFFLARLLPWIQPGRSHPLTWLALGCIVITMVTGLRGNNARRDVLGFVAGSLVGIPLEYWGTTRECWTYWDNGTPPLAAVLSHGFATVAFARAAAGLVWLRTRFWPAPSTQSGSAVSSAKHVQSGS